MNTYYNKLLKESFLIPEAQTKEHILQNQSHNFNNAREIFETMSEAYNRKSVEDLLRKKRRSYGNQLNLMVIPEGEERDDAELPISSPSKESQMNSLSPNMRPSKEFLLRSSLVNKGRNSLYLPNISDQTSTKEEYFENDNEIYAILLKEFFNSLSESPEEIKGVRRLEKTSEKDSIEFSQLFDSYQIRSNFALVEKSTVQKLFYEYNRPIGNCSNIFEFLGKRFNKARDVIKQFMSLTMVNFIEIMIIVLNCAFFALEISDVHFKFPLVFKIFFYQIYLFYFALRIIGFGFFGNENSVFVNFWNLTDFFMIGFWTFSLVYGDIVSFDISYKLLRIIKLYRIYYIFDKIKLTLKALFVSMPLMLDAFLLLTFLLITYSLIASNLMKSGTIYLCMDASSGIVHYPFNYCIYQICKNNSDICVKAIFTEKDIMNLQNIFFAIFHVLQLLTLDGWSDNSSGYFQNINYFDVLFYISFIVLGNYLLSHVILVIIKVNFSNTHSNIISDNNKDKQKKIYDFELMKRLNIWNRYENNSNLNSYQWIPFKVTFTTEKTNSMSSRIMSFKSFVRTSTSHNNKTKRATRRGNNLFFQNTQAKKSNKFSSSKKILKKFKELIKLLIRVAKEFFLKKNLENYKYFFARELKLGHITLQILDENHEYDSANDVQCQNFKKSLFYTRKISKKGFAIPKTQTLRVYSISNEIAYQRKTLKDSKKNNSSRGSIFKFQKSFKYGTSYFPNNLSNSKRSIPLSEYGLTTGEKKNQSFYTRSYNRSSIESDIKSSQVTPSNKRYKKLSYTKNFNSASNLINEELLNDSQDDDFNLKEEYEVFHLLISYQF